MDFRGRFIWRLGLLLGMGYVHSLLYGGDILQILALCGVCLVPLWRAPHLLVLSLSVFFFYRGRCGYHGCGHYFSRRSSAPGK